MAGMMRGLGQKPSTAKAQSHDIRVQTERATKSPPLQCIELRPSDRRQEQAPPPRQHTLVAILGKALFDRVARDAVAEALRHQVPHKLLVRLVVGNAPAGEDVTGTVAFAIL